MDKILRQRVYDSGFWKEKCFNINEATLCDRAAELDGIGGLTTGLRPSEFIVLLQKIILLQPPREIVLEYLHQPYFKYLTALAALYIRLTFPPMDVYQQLEPLLADFRKLRVYGQTGTSLTHMDEFIDDLLEQKTVLGVTLPRMPPRPQLEDRGLDTRPELLPSDSDGD